MIQNGIPASSWPDAAAIRSFVAALAAALTATLGVALGGAAALGQSLTVLPVNIEMPPAQKAATLTVINQGDAETSVQVRALAWSQQGGQEQLSPSDEVMASPPIATIAAGGTQVVRLVLRRAPQDREATYRLLLDQIPSAAAPGTVRIVLRLSIPVFAEPAIRAVPRLRFQVESHAGQAYLVQVNDGAKHEKLRDLALTTGSGVTVPLAADASPYLLAGTTSRRRIANAASLPTAGGSVRLAAHGDSGAIDERVPVVAVP